jgi:isopentenyl phosphate kinase
MSKVKLTSQLKWKAGHTNILPIVGEVVFDDNASIEVSSQEVADQLMIVMPEFQSEEITFVKEDEGDDLVKQTEQDDFLKSDEKDKVEKQIEENDLSGKVNLQEDEKTSCFFKRKS